MNIDISSLGSTPQPTSFGDVAQMLVARPEAPKEAPEGGEGLKGAVERANELAARGSKDVRFGIHEASGQFYVRVFDQKSGDVIKTVPPENLLDFRAAVDRSIGLVFDEVA